MKRKYLKSLFLAIESIFVFSFCMSLSNVKDSNLLIENKFEKSENTLENKEIRNYQTNFNITPVHKSGRDKLVWLIYGEGYTKDLQSTFVNDVKEIAKRMFDFEPYKQFSSYINVYAVNVISDYLWQEGDNNKKRTYFHSFTYPGKRFVNLNYFGSTRLRVLYKQIIDNYLDPGAKILENSVLVHDKKDGYGGTNFEWYSTLIKNKNPLMTTMIMLHEASHGFAFLDDEYYLGGTAREGVNRTKTNDLEKIKWNKFVGYKNVGAYEIEGSYIPTPYGQCLMSGYETGKFCPVCEYEIHRRLNQALDFAKDYFLLEPEVSLNYNWSTQISKLKFVTVFKNYENKNKNINVVFKNNGTPFLQKNFVIPNNGLEQLSINEDMKNFFINDPSQIIAEVIDNETNKIIYKAAILKSKSTKTFDIKLNFKVLDSSKSLPIIQYSTIKVREGEDYLIDPPRIDGYEFVKTNLNSNIISNLSSNQSIDYFYRSIDKKEIQIVVKDEQGKEIVRKKSTIYKSEYFIPKQNDLAFHYGWLVEPKKKKYKYYEIKENEEIEYIRKENYPFIELKKSNFEIGKRVGVSEMVNLRKMNGEIPEDQSGLSYMDNEIDWNKKGTYPIEFWYTNKYIDEDSIQRERTTNKKFFINIVDKDEIDNSEASSQNFMNNYFVNSYVEPTKDNIEKILNSKSHYDALEQNSKNNVDKMISNNNSNFGSFNSYMEIYNEVFNFSKKIENLMNKLKVDNNYITTINDYTYKKILNFEIEFNALKQNEKEFIDYKLGVPYQNLLDKSKKYNQNSNNKNNAINYTDSKWIWIIVVCSVISLIVIASLSLLFYKKAKNKK